MQKPDEASLENGTNKFAAVLGALGRGTLWIWLDRGLMPLGTSILGLFLIRYLGPADFGLYSAAVSTGIVAAIMMDLGMIRYAAREVAFAPSSGAVILKIGISITFVAAAGEVCMLGLAILSNSPYSLALALGLLLGSLDRFNDLTSAVLRAELRNREMFTGSFVGRSSRIVIMSVAIWHQIPVSLLLLGMAATTLPVMGIRLRQLRHYDFLHKWKRSDWPVFTKSLRSAWPFFSYSIAETASSYLQIPLLMLISGSVETGLFASAFVIAIVFPVGIHCHGCHASIDDTSIQGRQYSNAHPSSREIDACLGYYRLCRGRELVRTCS